MSVDHYENFPVASVLMPAKLKPAVIAVYAFARSADDIADEGDATAEQRLSELNRYEHELCKIEDGVGNPAGLFVALAAAIRQHRLPIAPLKDLLSAFKQDVVTTRYQNFYDLLDYCKRSANPVGTVMLYLYQAATPENLRDSDDICSALQLINFWQDIAVDWKKQRIYLPQEDLLRFNITEQHIAQEPADEKWQRMMRFQTNRARAILLRGSPLCTRLPGRIGWELRLVAQGGLRILERIDKANGDIFRHRPTLNKTDWILIFWRALWM